MAGIYIHIPFCKKKCYYCDFCSVVISTGRDEYISNLINETKIRKDYLGDEAIETIYFGGGTPSILPSNSINNILATIYKNFRVSSNLEITLEANPDDISMAYLKELLSSGINRLSIGIQSFDDNILQFLNRSHNSSEAKRCINEAFDSGFVNISADLIYGIPGLSGKNWEKCLNEMLAFNITHLSAYHLGIEEKTVLWKKKGQGKFTTITEDESEEHYQILTGMMNDRGFRHYEISNFCREGFISRHNSSYWTGKKYLGLGVSSHSFDSISRQWNTSDLKNYNISIEKGIIPSEVELLDTNMKYNEYIITSLRTSSGACIKEILDNFGDRYYRNFMNIADSFMLSGKLSEEKGIYHIPEKHWLISDSIISGLII